MSSDFLGSIDLKIAATSGSHTGAKYSDKTGDLFVILWNFERVVATPMFETLLLNSFATVWGSVNFILSSWSCIGFRTGVCLVLLIIFQVDLEKFFDSFKVIFSYSLARFRISFERMCRAYTVVRLCYYVQVCYVQLTNHKRSKWPEHTVHSGISLMNGIC